MKCGIFYEKIAIRADNQSRLKVPIHCTKFLFQLVRLLRKHDPLDETHLVAVGAYPTKKFQQSASTRRAQLKVAAATVRLNGSSQL